MIDLRRYGPPLARDILGDDDVGDALRAVVGGFGECFAVRASAGLVFGLLLDDGRRVAVKLVPPSEGRAALEGARAVQQALWARGFPAPRPLAGPLPVGRGHALVDEWREDGDFKDTRAPALRRAMAATLARFVAEAAAVPGVERLPRALNGRWERPHHPRFDFARADGSWIDERADRVRDVVFGPVSDWATGHADWSAQHLRWRDDRVAVVYDWDVVRDSEANVVGYASAVFTATWELDVAKAPSRADAEAFVADYEAAAGRALDRARVAAARTYLTAYCARAELSDLDGAEGDFQRALRALA
ncbi:MAG: hypothetical protein ICV64_04585 [Thermoleophilia bacterium]|nr:hypothetical protein [Thermoleophilia bacterium]